MQKVQRDISIGCRTLSMQLNNKDAKGVYLTCQDETLQAPLSSSKTKDRCYPNVRLF